MERVCAGTLPLIDRARNAFLLPRSAAVTLGSCAALPSGVPCASRKLIDTTARPAYAPQPPSHADNAYVVAPASIVPVAADTSITCISAELPYGPSAMNALPPEPAGVENFPIE